MASTQTAARRLSFKAECPGLGVESHWPHAELTGVCIVLGVELSPVLRFNSSLIRNHLIGKLQGYKFHAGGYNSQIHTHTHTHTQSLVPFGSIFTVSLSLCCYGALWLSTKCIYRKTSELPGRCMQGVITVSLTG